jgi:ATPase subunit of ABC transporter with duplicated ATPase domains
MSLLEGDRVMITKIKVKDKHIEFQLGGGGYGTAGDETSSSVYVPSASKSRREKNLEKDIKYETDERRRRQMREELDYLRRERERENRENRAEAAVAEEIAKARIQQKRLQGGSRFNIRFDRKVTFADLSPQVIMDALAEYLYFSESD